MSPLPAASSRFIAYSGDVLRYDGPVIPATRVASDSICGSLTAPALKIGVSTSSTPRAAKNSRTCASMRARSRNALRDAVGRQSASASDVPVATRYPLATDGLAELHHRARAQQRMPVRPFRFEQQDYRRAHVEPAELGTLVERHRRAGHARHHSARRGRDVAGPHGGHAAHVESTHQHQGELPELGVEQGEYAFVAREQARYVPCRGGIHAEQSSRYVNRVSHRAAQRHVNAVIVEGCQINGGEGAALEITGPRLPCKELVERVLPPLRLQQAVIIDGAALAHHAVHRAGDAVGVGVDRARVGAQRPGEELVEAAVPVRIGLRGLAHVDRKQPEEGARQQILEPWHPDACGGQDQPRQGVLRQYILQPDEQPPADVVAHPGPSTIRRKSDSRAITVNGPVSTAASLPSGLTTKIAPEWSTV